MTQAYDFAVIGGGNAGMAAARVAREAGRSVVLVERRDLGGTCALRGCVPKKVLVAAAEVLDAIARAPEHCIRVAQPHVDWPGLMRRKQRFVADAPRRFTESLERRGVRVLRGNARFVAEHELDVDGLRLTAQKVVVATGSLPLPLPIAGAEALATSDDVLNLPELPRSVVFVGAGVVAMELAHVLARAGAKVTLLEALARPLSGFDADLVDGLVAETRRIGVELVCDVEVRQIEREHGETTLVYVERGERRRVTAELAVNGAGRVPALADLRLEQAGVELDGDRPKLDRYLRSTSNPDVLFAGDTLPDAPQLSPLATYEGSIAAKNALATGELRVPEYGDVPAVVFSIPALAKVGLGVEDAERQGHDVVVETNDLSGWISGRTYAETAARSKVLLEKGSGKILGAHLLGHGAQETIHAFAFHMRHGLPAAELAAFIAAYPTFHADLDHMLY